jgi:hypothetical protein
MEDGPTVDNTQIVPNTKPLCQQQQQQVPLLYHFSKVVTLRTKNLIATKEATFVYHTVTHDLSFKTADCSMELISQLFDSKFSLPWTSCEEVI